MRCPNCGHDEDKVVDSRPTDDSTAIRRRRECNSCHHRFTTYEKVEYLPLYVVKKDGSRELFDRDKLIDNIMKACSKRPISTDQIGHLVSTIEQRCSNSLNHEVSSQVIGQMVMDGLREIDEVAYVRFASVYRQFTDVNSFLEELVRLLEQKGNLELDDDLADKLRAGLSANAGHASGQKDDRPDDSEVFEE